jgi:transposase
VWLKTWRKGQIILKYFFVKKNKEYKMSLPLEYKFMPILFKIQGYAVKNLKEVGLEIEVELEATNRSSCPKCGLSGSCHDYSHQRIYIGSILGRAVYGSFRVNRINCPNCGVLTEKHGVSEGKKRYAKAVGQDIVRYTKLLDNKSVSRLLGLSCSMVYRIDQEELNRLMRKYSRGISGTVNSEISIDEVSYKRRHHYATVVTNYADAKVVWLEKGRKGEDLHRAYRYLNEGVNKIKTVAMDFWPAYEKETRKTIPDAQIIFDRFHLSRILNRKLEEERRAYQNQIALSLSDEEKKEIKKQFRWLILKRKANLSDSNKRHLQELKEKNEPLYEMYLLKEEFLEIFEIGRTREEGQQMIMSWAKDILKLNYKSFKSFARTVLKRIDSIVDWFDHPISNAKAEGVNNVIKTLLKRAYGYKDFEYFRAKVLQKCGYLMEYATGN